MCQKQKPSLAEATTAAVQKENIQSILGLLEPRSQAEEAVSTLNALHLLAGAMDGEEVVPSIDSGHILKILNTTLSLFSNNGSLAIFSDISDWPRNQKSLASACGLCST